MIERPQLWLPGDPLDWRPRRDRRRLPAWRKYGIGYPGQCCVNPCDVCDDGTTPDEFSIVLSGFTQSCCTSFNGTFVAIQNTPFVDNPCIYRYFFPVTTCSAEMIELYLQLIGADVYLTVSIRAGSPPAYSTYYVTWQKVYSSTSSIDCALSGESIPYVSGTGPLGACANASSTTCIVTAV